MSVSKAANTYKTQHGSHEELLNKNNYETWAPIMKRELQGRDMWGFIDNTRTAPEPLDPAAPATDVLLYRQQARDHRAELSATGSAIFHACSKSIQDRYLNDSLFAEPRQMWELLATSLQGNDEESRSKLLTKFMTMTKAPETPMAEFSKKLKAIQALLNGDAATPFITDSMVIKQLLTNAGSHFDYLTNVLRTTPDLTLVGVLKRYELAEEDKEAKDLKNKSTAQQYDDSVSSLAAQNG